MCVPQMCQVVVRIIYIYIYIYTVGFSISASLKNRKSNIGVRKKLEVTVGILQRDPTISKTQAKFSSLQMIPLRYPDPHHSESLAPVLSSYFWIFSHIFLNAWNFLPMPIHSTRQEKKKQKLPLILKHRLTLQLNFCPPSLWTSLCS